MIAIESFKKFKIIDITLIISISLVWWLLSFAIEKFIPVQSSYMISLLMATFLMSFAVHLIRKAGTSTLFYLIGSLMLYDVNDIGIDGVNKVIIFLIAGIIFELAFLILKVEIKSIQIDIISATAISSMLIPLLTGLFLSPIVSFNLITPLLNLTLLSLLIGIAGSVLSSIFWHNIKNNKMIIKYEYSQ